MSFLRHLKILRAYFWVSMALRWNILGCHLPAVGMWHAQPLDGGWGRLQGACPEDAARAQLERGNRQGGAKWLNEYEWPLQTPRGAIYVVNLAGPLVT